jgi:murein DD-endopeptidase MepM/ murein hydrolase activator NlpD
VLGLAQASTFKVLLSSTIVLPGNTLRVEIDGLSLAMHARAVFRGKKYPFYEVGPNAQRALIGVLLGSATGQFPLQIETKDARAARFVPHEQVDVEIASRTYVVENISFAPEKTQLMQWEHQESVRIHRAAQTLSPEQYWEGVFGLPVQGAVIGAFGLKRVRNGTIDAGFHKGIDLRASAGTPVLASNAGIVLLAARLHAHGGTVLLNHGQGVMTIYLHMQSILVKPGQKVVKGQIIGKVGSTGLSTSPHVHWQVFVHGVPVDPAPWAEQEF